LADELAKWMRVAAGVQVLCTVWNREKVMIGADLGCSILPTLLSTQEDNTNGSLTYWIIILALFHQGEHVAEERPTAARSV